MTKLYKNEESNAHAGHRHRLKSRYVYRGAEKLSDEELLELMLFYAVPQRDTAPLAAALLNRYGSLSAMLYAPKEHLMEVDGINEHSAILLSLFTDVSRIYRMDKLNDDNRFRDREKIARYLCAYMESQRDDCTVMLCLDKQDRLLSCETVFDFPVDLMTTAHIRAVVHRALGVGAYSVALAHKHADGCPEPSDNDVTSTDALAVALGNVDVKLIDHLILTDDTCVSISDYADAVGYGFI